MDSITKLRFNDAHAKAKLRLGASFTLQRFLLKLRIQISEHDLNVRHEHRIGAVQGKNSISDPHCLSRRVAVQIASKLLRER